MVKALDCRSDEDVRAGSFPVTGNFFFLLMMMVERHGAAQASAKHERLSVYKIQSLREQSYQECECKAQSLRERIDRECKATESTCLNERSECRC